MSIYIKFLKLVNNYGAKIGYERSSDYKKAIMASISNPHSNNKFNVLLMSSVNFFADYYRRMKKMGLTYDESIDNPDRVNQLADELMLTEYGVVASKFMEEVFSELNSLTDKETQLALDHIQALDTFFKEIMCRHQWNIMKTLIKDSVRDKLLQLNSGANYYVILEQLVRLSKKEFTVTITQSELAEQLHLSRPTVRRALEYFKVAGIAISKYGNIVINKDDILN